MKIPIKEIILEAMIIDKDNSSRLKSGLISGGVSGLLTGGLAQLTNPDDPHGVNPYLVGGSVLTGGLLGAGLSGSKHDVKNNIIIPTLAAGVGGTLTNDGYQYFNGSDYEPVNVPLTMALTGGVGSLLLSTKNNPYAKYLTVPKVGK